MISITDSEPALDQRVLFVGYTYRFAIGAISFFRPSVRPSSRPSVHYFTMMQ